MADKKRWIVVAKLYLDSGTEFESDIRVNHPSHTYESRVVQWGTIDRSIPSPPGLPQVSDAIVRIADKDRKFRDLLSHQTPRRRTMELKILQEGDSESATDPVYVGEVVDVEFIPGAIDITLRDKTFAWIDEEIPAMITKENFPYITDDAEGGFLPIISGQVRSEGLGSPVTGTQGVIALPHIGFNVLTGDRYGLSATPIWDVVLYRQENFGSPETLQWVVISPDEYNVTIIPTILYGLSTNPTFVDFIDEQPQGTEIRADVDGIYFRGGWGTLAENGFNTFVSPPTGTPGALRNPIDFFINMTFFVMSKATGLSVDPSTVFNQMAIAALWTKFETLGIFCDGAITKPLSCREWLGQFLTSFNLDMYLDRNGLITLNFTDETDPARPVFTEGRLILKETFIERLPQPAINQVQFRYQYNYATDSWGTWGLANNLDDQATLGTPGVSSPLVRDLRVEKEVLDLFYIRNLTSAEYIVSKRLAFLSLGSFRQEFQVPAPETLDDLELAKLIGLTHSQGLEMGGYVNREVKVIGLTLDLDNLRYTVRGILRVPQTITIPVDTPPAPEGVWLRVYHNNTEIAALARWVPATDADYIPDGRACFVFAMDASFAGGQPIFDNFEYGDAGGIIFSDDFNRADAANLGADWAEHVIDTPPVFRIKNNGISIWTSLRLFTGGDVPGTRFNIAYPVTTDVGAQYARVTLRDGGAVGGIRMAIRAGGGTGIGFRCYAMDIAVELGWINTYPIIAGDYLFTAESGSTTKSITTTPPVTGDTFTMTVGDITPPTIGTLHGAQVRVYVNDVEIPKLAMFIPNTLETYFATGKFCVLNSAYGDPGDPSGVAVFDDFEGGNPGGVIFTDDFDRADADDWGVNWTEDLTSSAPIFRIYSNGNQVYTLDSYAADTWDVNYPTSATAIGDQYVKITLRDDAGLGGQIIGVRGGGTLPAFNGYLLTIIAGYGIFVSVIVGGVTRISQAAPNFDPPAPGDVFKLEVIDV